MMDKRRSSLRRRDGRYAAEREEPVMVRVASQRSASAARLRALRRRRASLSVGRAGGRDPGVAGALQVAAGYAWRLIVVLAAVYLAFTALTRVKLAVVAVFVALVITALLRPVVNQLARLLPRPLAVVVSMLAGLAVVVGLFASVGVAIAGQYGALVRSFQSGVSAFTAWLRTSRLHVRPEDISRAAEQARVWLTEHRAEVAGQVLGGAGTAAELLTGAAVALFCAVFFLASGDRMWSWFLAQLSRRAAGRWDRAGRAAWATFEGYSQATVLIAASNAAIVAVVLLILRVPLAIPLAVLVFLASFIPLVGGSISLAVAALVAFAARGPWIALAVVILIPVIGQIEGHVLQPLIMGHRVRLHPVVVVLTVVCGSLLGGLLGAVLAVPLVAVGWSVLRELRRQPHLDSRPTGNSGAHRPRR
jgi:predicted PurR-regulated permease PerM